MPLTKLFAGDVPGYFRENADDAQALWIFLHIPKTAGSSFRAEIARRLRPSMNICLNAHGRPGMPRFDSVNDALEHFLTKSVNEKTFRFASGHMTRPQIARIRDRFPNARIVTMLRHPLTRVVSDYRYQRTPKHPPHKDFIRHFPNLESYVRTGGSRDKMFEFLKSSPSDTVDDVLRDLEVNFAFVGLTEIYDLSRRMLFHLFGAVPEVAKEHNRTEALPENEVSGLDDLLPLIAQLNPRDTVIHEHFSRKFEQLSPVISDHLNDAPRLQRSLSRQQVR